MSGLTVTGAVVRYGDVVAVVIAATEEKAREAAKAVKVEIEPLPEYLSFLDAVAPDALRIHTGPNTYLMQPVLKGQRAEDAIDEAFCSVEGSFHSQREPHLSIEGDTLQGYWDTEGNLTIHCKYLIQTGCRCYCFCKGNNQIRQRHQRQKNLGHIIDQGDYLSLCQQPFIYLSAPIPDNRNNPGVDNNICHRIQQR